MHNFYKKNDYFNRRAIGFIGSYTGFGGAGLEIMAMFLYLILVERDMTLFARRGRGWDACRGLLNFWMSYFPLISKPNEKCRFCGLGQSASMRLTSAAQKYQVYGSIQNLNFESKRAYAL